MERLFCNDPACRCVVVSSAKYYLLIIVAKRLIHSLKAIQRLCIPILAITKFSRNPSYSILDQGHKLLLFFLIRRLDCGVNFCFGHSRVLLIRSGLALGTEV
jgi:hypothetical protein